MYSPEPSIAKVPLPAIKLQKKRAHLIKLYTVGQPMTGGKRASIWQEEAKRKDNLTDEMSPIRREVKEKDMARGAVQKRRPTLNDLSDRQRRLYDALPDDFKAEFLDQLPDITVSSAQARKKAQLIRDRMSLLDSVIGQLESHKTQLARVAKDLENGADPDSVDLRHELKPPSINGVALRYVRRGRG
jgi:hypothetical protein